MKIFLSGRKRTFDLSIYEPIKIPVRSDPTFIAEKNNINYEMSQVVTQLHFRNICAMINNNFLPRKELARVKTQQALMSVRGKTNELY